MDRIKILIADSDKQSQKIYNEAFVDAVFDRMIVSNGKECLEAYEKFKPDLMLIELKLQLMTGYSVLREIRTKIKDTRTAIVMIATIIDKDNLKMCEDAGIQGFLSKPVLQGTIAVKVLDGFIAKYPDEGKKFLENYLLYFRGLSALNIFDVVSGFTKLEAEGNHHKGVIPIKGYMETVVIDSQKRSFTIPKLNKQGNIFDFVQLAKELSPVAALEYLAPEIRKQ